MACFQPRTAARTRGLGRRIPPRPPIAGDGRSTRGLCGVTGQISVLSSRDSSATIGVVPDNMMAGAAKLETLMASLVSIPKAPDAERVPVRDAGPGASLSRRKALAAASFGSWPLCTSSKKSLCRATTARAFAFAASASSALSVPVGGILLLLSAAVAGADGSDKLPCPNVLTCSELVPEHAGALQLVLRAWWCGRARPKPAPKSAGRRDLRTLTLGEGGLRIRPSSTLFESKDAPHPASGAARSWAI
mmetsp:Transcript_17721/g.41208  ORF Transcript_17721/g.41208 Transcript_17721/m.41208 type:complete len:248 (+) Transcript_17721:185-928(+)